MKEKREAKHATITFRVTEDLKKKIEQMAIKDNRTLSNMIVVILEKAAKEKK